MALHADVSVSFAATCAGERAGAAIRRKSANYCTPVEKPGPILNSFCLAESLCATTGHISGSIGPAAFFRPEPCLGRPS